MRVEIYKSCALAAYEIDYEIKPSCTGEAGILLPNMDRTVSFSSSQNQPLKEIGNEFMPTIKIHTRRECERYKWILRTSSSAHFSWSGGEKWIWGRSSFVKRGRLSVLQWTVITSHVSHCNSCKMKIEDQNLIMVKLEILQTLCSFHTYFYL